MSLTACRECGAAVPTHARACPKCGASMGLVSYGEYQPAPRRSEVPERPWWRTIGGWLNAASAVVLLAICVFVADAAIRGSAAAGRRSIEEKAAANRRAIEEKEVALEAAHLRKVHVWLRETSASTPAPQTAGRTVPTSDRAKELWVVNRTLVDGALWRREILERHGVRGDNPLEAMGAAEMARYSVDASRHREVGRYVVGRAAAVAEIQRRSAAWTEEHVAALAQESGWPVGEIRAHLPPGVIGVRPEEAREAAVLLKRHRYLVRIDPQAHHGGSNQMLFERNEDFRRVRDLQAEVNEATESARRARGASESATVYSLGAPTARHVSGTANTDGRPRRGVARGAKESSRAAKVPTM